jgi:hypothetical protein
VATLLRALSPAAAPLPASLVPLDARKKAPVFLLPAKAARRAES